GLRDKQADVPLHPLQVSRLRLIHPRGDALHLHRARDRRRTEPDRQRPVPVQIRPNPRTLRRRHTQPQRPAVRRHPRPPPAAPTPRATPGLRSSPRVATPTAPPPWMNSITPGSSTGANPACSTRRNLHLRRNSVRALAARTAVLSEGQRAMLAEHGEERRAEVGDVLFRVGDRRYPLIAIIEGEAAVLDQTGAEINRHGPGGFSASRTCSRDKPCSSRPS